MINQQFNEMVYQLQSIEEAVKEDKGPQITSVIAKLYSVKSAYD